MSYFESLNSLTLAPSLFAPSTKLSTMRLVLLNFLFHFSYARWVYKTNKDLYIIVLLVASQP